MISEEQLREIEERSSRITPGPWSWYCYRRGYEIVTMPSERKVVKQDGGVGFVRDADFISHAREDVPAMLATIRELQARVAELGPDARLGRMVREMPEGMDLRHMANGPWWSGWNARGWYGEDGETPEAALEAARKESP